MVESVQRKHSLSPSQRHLLLLMQQINFGRIERLAIQDGEPVFDPPPLIVREIKFGGDNGRRAETRADDFLLKAQVVDLFAQLKELLNGTIKVLSVKHGLPFGMELEHVAA